MSLSAHAPLTPSDPESGAASANGRACLGAKDQVSCRVDLVWRDPETGAQLALDLEASPGLVASLREAGFQVQEGPAAGPPGTQAA